MISDFLKIDGVNMPEPDDFPVRASDIVSAGSFMLENGNEQRDVIAFAFRSTSCTWTNLPQDEAELLLAAIDKASFSVTHSDPKAGTKTTTCRAGEWEANQVPGTESQSDGPWWDVSFDLTESAR